MFHRIARCGRCVSVHAVLTVEFESSPGVEVSGEESADEGFEVMNLQQSTVQVIFRKIRENRKIQDPSPNAGPE